MKTLEKTFSRKFGKIEVTIKGSEICINGDYYTNWGHFYPFAFERFKSHKDESAWNRPQVIGMESDFGMHENSRIRAWLYAKIKSGKLDYLIEED